VEEQRQDHGMSISPDKFATGMLVSFTFAILFESLAAKEDIFTYFKCGVSGYTFHFRLHCVAYWLAILLH
jgi:hypothetical protein